MDADAQGRKPAQRHGFQASRKPFPAGGGRSVDIEAGRCDDERCQKGLISRNFCEAL